MKQESDSHFKGSKEHQTNSQPKVVTIPPPPIKPQK